jgi:hypothetical protein
MARRASETHTDGMAGEAELDAAGFRRHHVTARTLNIAHPQDTRQMGPFCRLDVADPLEVPLGPGVYAWVTDAEVRYVGHASVLRQIVRGTRMGRAYNDYTYVPPSKLQQTSSPRVYVNGLLNAAIVGGGQVTWWWRTEPTVLDAKRREARLIHTWNPPWNRARPVVW